MSRTWHLERTGSTQVLATTAARAGALPGSTYVAQRQTSGLGRRDHRWISPIGGLYLSRIVAGPRGHPELLPMAVGVELRRCLAAVWRVEARLRWPNDLVVGVRGRKLGGILADRVEGPRGPVTVVGIGLNVCADRSAFSPELRDGIARLADLTDAWVEPAAVEPEAIRAIDRAVERIRFEAGARGVVREARRSLDGIGREVELDGAPVGRLLGIDASGALLTRANGRPLAHSAGTLRFLPAPPTPGRRPA